MINITSTENESMIFSHIEKKDTKIVTAHLTMSTHQTGTAEEEAVTELYTDMMLSGAGPYSRTQFLDAINGLGASVGISVGEGTITFTFETLQPKLDKVLDLVKLMFLEPHFAATELTRSKITLHNSLIVYKEQARAMAYDAFVREIYPKEHRAFTYSPDEVDAAAKSVTKLILQGFHQNVRQGQWTVTVGGSLKAANRIKNTLNSLQLENKKTPLSESTTTPKPTKNVLVTTAIPSQQNIEFSIGNTLPLSYRGADMPAIYFGLAVLGKWGGFAGRLMSTVREKEGLTYGIYARIESTSIADSGHWRIMTFFAPQDCIRGITSTRREIAAIVEKGVTDNEVRRFKDILETGHVLLFDSLVQLTATIHQNRVRGLSYAEFVNFHAGLKLLTKRQINNALKKYLNPKQLVFSAAGPVTKILTDLEKATR